MQNIAIRIFRGFRKKSPTAPAAAANIQAPKPASVKPVPGSMYEKMITGNLDVSTGLPRIFHHKEVCYHKPIRFCPVVMEKLSNEMVVKGPLLFRISCAVFLSIVIGWAVYARFTYAALDHPVAVRKFFDLTVYFLTINLVAELFRRKWLLRACVIFLILAALTEAYFTAILNDPEARKFFLKKGHVLVSKVYWSQMDVIQYNPACAQYDAELNYTLKPGACVFKNIEFSTDYYINSRGLRDDEESLVAPEAIVAGDSFAMGWGVEQDEALPQVIEKLSGFKTLNAGISSYGTVSEMLMLKRLDTSKLKYLVIQYYRNDRAENNSFMARKNRHTAVPLEKHESMVSKTESSKKRYIGKYTASFLSGLYGYAGDRFTTRFAHNQGGEEDARLFLNAFKYATPWENLDEENLHIFILAVEPGHGFCQSVRDQIRGLDLPISPDRVSCEDISLLVWKEPFLSYPLDFHWNARGHRLIARKVLDWMRKSSPGLSLPPY